MRCICTACEQLSVPQPVGVPEVAAMVVHPDEVALAQQAVAAAGAVLAEQVSGTAVLSSVGRDIKTSADMDAERAMLSVLRASDLPVLSEEQGADDTFNLDADGWIIDPLDGTMNFVRGIPMACVCAALWRDGRPVLGVLQELHVDRLWVGGVDLPATCNGEACRVSEATDPEQAVLVTGFPRGFKFEDASLRAYLERMTAFKKVRMLGSAGIALAWTAGGMADLYLEDDIFIWDVAAGLAIVEAAGGSVRTTPFDDQWKCDVRSGSAALVALEQAAGS